MVLYFNFTNATTQTPHGIWEGLLTIVGLTHSKIWGKELLFFCWNREPSTVLTYTHHFMIMPSLHKVRIFTLFCKVWMSPHPHWKKWLPYIIRTMLFSILAVVLGMQVQAHVINLTWFSSFKKLRWLPFVSQIHYIDYPNWCVLLFKVIVWREFNNSLHKVIHVL